MSPRRAVRLTLLGAALLVCAGTSARAEVYRYVDETGTPHFTDSRELIPPRYRNQVGDISGKLAEKRRINIFPGLDQPPSTSPGTAAGAAPKEVASSQGLPVNFDLGRLKSFGALLLVGLVLLVPLGFFLTAWILCLACRIAAPEVPSFGRACKVVFFQILAGLGAGIVLGLVVALTLGLGGLQTTGSNVASSLLSLAVSAAVLSRMLEMSFPRGLGVVVVHALLSVVIFLVPIALLGVVMGGFGATLGGTT